MDAHSTDIFGPVEEGGNIGENAKKEEWEEQEREEDSTSSEKEGEVEDDEPDYDLWSPLRQTKSRGRSQRNLHERCQTATG